MDCKQIRPILHSYLDHELDQRDSVEIEIHLAKCPRCLAEADFFRCLRSKVRDVCPRHLAPVHLEANLRAKLRQESERQTTRPRFALAFASAFLVAFLGWSLLPSPSSPPPPSSAAPLAHTSETPSSFFPPGVILPSSDPASPLAPVLHLPDLDPKTPPQALSKDAKKQRCLMRKLRWLRERQREYHQRQGHFPSLPPSDSTPLVLPVKAP